MRILKRDQEKVDEVMQTVFKWPKRKHYIVYDKNNGDFDEEEMN